MSWDQPPGCDGIGECEPGENPSLPAAADGAPRPPAPRARADPHRLQQCLTALVGNALLYSDGPVILTASSCPAGELVLHVIDRGPGTAGLASPHRGSGIRLSLECLLIEAMGGRVQVADAPGGGADFQLVLAGVATRENTEVVGGGTGVL